MASKFWRCPAEAVDREVTMKTRVARLSKSGSETDSDAGDGAVQSVDRALHIIETLAEDGEGYRLTDLAIRTGLPPSTVHRLLATLEKRRFVQFDRASSTWRIGAKSYLVGATFMKRNSFATQALPYLRKLRDQTQETANLAIVDDGALMVLTRVESRELMRSVSRVGGRVSMATSGLGKALLSAYSEAEVFAVIKREGMPRLTSNSIVRAGDLCKSLYDIRQRGYSVDDEEAQIGLRCVSAVIYDGLGEPHAAISVSGKTSRVPDHRLLVLGKAVQEAARELTSVIGGIAPHRT
jgi:IclR family transcriptional regulator, acetate operon repressor